LRAVLGRDRKLCCKAERQQHLAGWGNIRNSCWPLTAAQPDLTLDEVVAAMCKQRVAGGVVQLQKEGRGRRSKGELSRAYGRYTTAR
jgi:hypothetical protein